MATSRSSSWADVATIGHYKHQRRIIEQQMLSNTAEMEVTEKCSDSIVKPYTTGTEKSKSHGLMVTLGKCAPKGKGKSSLPTTETETPDEKIHRGEVQLNDFLEKSLDKFKKVPSANISSDENQNDYHKVMREMYSHRVLSQQFHSRTSPAEVELDLEREFPTLGGNKTENDGIVLGSSSFYQMKRYAEKVKQPEEGHKKILKMSDGSLYFGDETNVRTNYLQEEPFDVVDDVVDNTFPVEVSVNLSNSETQDYGRPEWENEDSDIYRPLESMIDYSKCHSIPEEITNKNTDVLCDTEKHVDPQSPTRRASDIDKNVQDGDIEEKGIIWGIDSSLVNVPRCPFDLNILPESWLSADLQGWMPGDKDTPKVLSETETLKSQVSTVLGNFEAQSKEDVDKSDFKSDVEHDKHESGIDSNPEVISDNDHCDKSFERKSRRIVGSTDDSNRSSPPSDSNVSSDSEDECDPPSGPPSVAEFNYDTDDLAGTQGTSWGSRCPSPDQEENEGTYTTPVTTRRSTEESKSVGKGKELKPEAKTNVEKVLEADVTLDGKVCDALENIKDLNPQELPPDKFGEFVNSGETETDAVTKDSEPDINSSTGPAVFEPQESPRSTKDKSPERLERKTLTPRANLDSSSGPSRESSPYRPKQAYPSTSNSDSVDMSRNIDSPSKGNASPKVVRVRRKRRLPSKRRPENTEKTIETADDKPEVVEKLIEDVTLPQALPSMTLKNMTTLPLSDIIAIRKSLGMGTFKDMTQNKKEVVAHKVTERTSSPTKLLMPKEPNYEKGFQDVSPSRLDEYSAWDNGGWNPFDATEEKESVYDNRYQQVRAHNVIHHDNVSVADTQSDTDSGHWTAAHEDRSSHRSSPRVSIPTPTREGGDRLSVQSEETVDGDTNSSTSESVIFPGDPSHAQPSRTNSRNNTSMNNSNQQVPFQQFPNAMPAASSMPNMEHNQWFNMAMQCMAQQYMAQQMQLQMQMQQGCAFTPWMAPNQNSGHPMTSFRCPPGLNNQVPVSPGQPGMVHNSVHVPTSQVMTDNSSHIQQAVSSPQDISANYYGPQPINMAQQNATVNSNILKPNSAFTVNPGTSVTVDRPGRDSIEREKTITKKQDSVKEFSANSRCERGERDKETKRQSAREVREITSRQISAKRRQVKVSCVKDDEGDENKDDISDNELENTVKVVTRKEKPGVVSVERRRVKNAKEYRKKETVEETQEEAAAKRSSKKTKKVKRPGSNNNTSRLERLQQWLESHNEKIVIGLQVMLMFSVAILLYDVLETWKANTMR